MKYVVIGGDAAGMSAAMQIIRNDKQAEVITLEKGSIYSYAQCGLPYIIGGHIPSTDDLIARKRETFQEKYGIDARIYHEVTKIDPKTKTVYGQKRDSNVPFDIQYDKLLIATGAEPLLPKWEGSKLNGIHTIKTIPDLHSLIEDIGTSKKEVAIIGGGYIGLEMAENFHDAGHHVTIIEQAPQLATVFDADMAEHIHNKAKEKNITLYLNESVQAFTGEETVHEVITDKRSIRAEIVIVAVGVKPNTQLVEQTGIHLSSNGAIIVNAQMETNIKDIYAAGDCATQYHRIKQKNDYIPLGTHANKQGRIAGLTMAGVHRTFQGVVGTAIIKFFDLTLARTGISEKEAEALRFPYHTIKAELPHIAAYYPTPEPMQVKLMYEAETNQLLGGQIIGKLGVDKRIDVLATALYHHMTIQDLEDLDLAYAPPYNMVWDPIQQTARRREH
ncbi:FAD-dependent oxidoreductase [Alkalihalobacillus sp. LMS39]|uniref:FAD-dependent oxidoreductase n=1 Tax=Alkalihalobacillus sp. LMS39 TaxID=2924032 RepID=UPI001FB53BEF|nr:FAD-dependent oxidoreductase [Alkalihalobacillus sp. LMS39]UOE93960.1 FAD-dependent oxidoreductase [Alkalihalobacillus sp. LMS39]